MPIESEIKRLLKKMILFSGICYLSLSCFLVLNAIAAGDGIVVFDDGDTRAKLGGRFHLQYHMEDPCDGDSVDDLFLRRLRMYIEGRWYQHWNIKIEFDIGDALDDNESVIKNAFVRYSGFNPFILNIGNMNFPFSREMLTSTNRQQLVERTFVGDHEYGTPDKNLGIHVTTSSFQKKFAYALSIASSTIDPDASKIDFDTPVHQISNSDFNEGWMLGGRIDFTPFGPLIFGQGDFEKNVLFGVGLAGFVWANDNDNNMYTANDGTSISMTKADMDKVNGIEFDMAFRGFGWSVDGEYNRFKAESVDSNFDGGIIKNGETDLQNWAVKGGYMILPGKFETVIGFESQDATNYAREWTRLSFGLNWFFREQDIKIQATYRISENLNGKKNDDTNELFLQFQYVF